MRCLLELRSPNHGTGTAERWEFSGADGRALEDCLATLDAFATEPPTERFTFKGIVHEGGDRWRAAMVRWGDEPFQRGRISFDPVQAEAAWTVDGAHRLAEILPESFDDLRTAIAARFGEGPSPAG